MIGLSPFQDAVARLFFSLPSANGFVLAGGGALLANGLSSRPTRDLDFFSIDPAAVVDDACDALIEALAAVEVEVYPRRRTTDFARLHLVGVEELVVDLCVDSVPVRPPVHSPVGPTFSTEDLGGRKLLALYSRAEARDFVDVFHLAALLDRDLMIDIAAMVDLRFDERVLADMFRKIGRAHV